MGSGKEEWLWPGVEAALTISAIHDRSTLWLEEAPVMFADLLLWRTIFFPQLWRSLIARCICFS